MHYSLFVGAVTLTVIVISYYVFKKSKKQEAKRKMLEKRAKIQSNTNELKKRLREGLKNGNTSLITDERLAILNMDIKDVMNGLNKGTLKPVEVLEAFQAKAIEVNEKKNCVCEFILQARDWALEAEKIPKKERTPLFGIPVSVKECIHVEGYDTTFGLAKFIDQPARESATLVKAMRQLGAIPFCITNVPQQLSLACSNPIYGVTKHPLDDGRTPGGSSGGEGCLIAMGGSPLGIGTDIGGSLRTPSYYCGITSLKPTSNRLPELGRITVGNIVVPGIHSNIGFMAKSLDMLTTAHEVILSNVEKIAKLDSFLLPIPWNKEKFNMGRRLRVGWFSRIECYEPPPGCQRAVNMVINGLQVHGHHTEEISSDWMNQAVDLYLDFIFSDDGKLFVEALKDEIIDEDLQFLLFIWRIPFWIRKMILAPLFKHKSAIQSKFLRAGATRGFEVCKKLGETKRLKTDLLNQLNKHNLDVIIAPVASLAPKLPDVKDLKPVAFVTAPCNLLDIPAGTMKVTTETDDDQMALQTNYPKVQKDAFFHKLKETNKGGTGLPIGIQIIGKPYQEEVVLSAMKEIQRILDKESQN